MSSAPRPLTLTPWRCLVLAFAAIMLATAFVPIEAHAFYLDDHETELVSRTEAGELPAENGNADSTLLGISGNGRYVLLYSRATNFPVGNVPEGQQVLADSALFRKDRETGKLELVARPTLLEGETLTFCGTPQGGNAGISADGRYVAFATAEQLVPADTNFNLDVYLRDMSKKIGTTKATDEAGAWELVSARDGGNTPASYTPLLESCEEQSLRVGSGLPITGKMLSADGRRVVFLTGPGTESDLPSRETTDVPARSLFWRDLDAGQTRTVAREVFNAEGDPVPQTDAGVPVGIEEPVSSAVRRAAISGDGTKVAWVGKYAPLQVRVLSQEYGEFAQSRTTNHLMWRDMSLGAAGVTRRVAPLVDFDDPACTPEALAALTSEQLHDPTQEGPCLGPLVQDPSLFGADAGDVALSNDGLTVAFTLTAAPRPSSIGTEAQDAWVTSMATGVSRKSATRIVTRAVGTTTESGAEIGRVALSGDGRLLTLRTRRIDFSALTAPSPLGPFPKSAEIDDLYRITLAPNHTPEQIELVTRGFEGGELAGESGGNGLAISQDGSTIAFDSRADNLVEGDSSGEQAATDVFASVPRPGPCEATPLPPECAPLPPGEGGGTGGGGASVPPPPGNTPHGKTLQQLRKEARAKCRKKKGRARKRCMKRANSIGRKQKG